MSNKEQELRKKFRLKLQEIADRNKLFDNHGNEIKAIHITDVMRLLLEEDTEILKLQKEIQELTASRMELMANSAITHDEIAMETFVKCRDFGTVNSIYPQLIEDLSTKPSVYENDIIIDNLKKLSFSDESIKKIILTMNSFSKIIICGLDGSGKTTLNNVLTEKEYQLSILEDLNNFLTTKKQKIATTTKSLITILEIFELSDKILLKEIPIIYIEMNNLKIYVFDLKTKSYSFL